MKMQFNLISEIDAEQAEKSRKSAEVYGKKDAHPEGECGISLCCSVTAVHSHRIPMIVSAPQGCFPGRGFVSRHLWGTLKEVATAFFSFNETPYRQLLIGGIAVILLATSGITAVLAWVPASRGATGVDSVLDTLPAQAESTTRFRVKCAECGVVESTRVIEQGHEGIDPDATAALTKSGRNVVPRKVSRISEVTVRMQDGASHRFVDANPANWRPGERVIFIKGTSKSND